MAGFVKADRRAGLRAEFTNAAETQIDLDADIVLTDCSGGPEPGAPEAAPVVLAVVRFTG